MKFAPWGGIALAAGVLGSVLSVVLGVIAIVVAARAADSVAASGRDVAAENERVRDLAGIARTLSDTSSETLKSAMATESWQRTSSGSLLYSDPGTGMRVSVRSSGRKHGAPVCDLQQGTIASRVRLGCTEDHNIFATHPLFTEDAKGVGGVGYLAEKDSWIA
jgi:hypothetical protein